MNKKSLIHRAALLAVLSGLYCQSVGLAAPGDLDTTFGGTGKVRTGFGSGTDMAYAVASQADGKLILAGISQVNLAGSVVSEFSLVRLDTNNVLDSSFGNGGKVLTPVNVASPSATDARLNAVRVQADGKIVVAGYAYPTTNYSSFTVARYNSDGSLDTTFGTNGTGIVYTDFGQGTVIRGIALQLDGKIVAAGYTVYGADAGQGAVALARYQTNGVLDVSFGTGGKQITSGVTGYTGASGVVVQVDGKIVAVGIGIGAGDSGVDFALYRYTTNGVLDATFGGGSGEVFTRIGANTYNDDQNSAAAVTIQFGNGIIGSPDKIVVAGVHRNYATYTEVFAVARYNLDGSLDTTFGSGGIVTNSITTASGTFGDGDTAVAVTVSGSLSQPRKITVGGFSAEHGTNYVTLARYTASGAFDTTFGPNGTGINLIALSPGVDAAINAMAVQSGKFVLAGFSGTYSHNYDFLAARFNSDGSTDTNFGVGGILKVDVSDLDSTIQGLAIQSNGKLVAAGSANNSTNEIFALARYNVDGSLDASFGSGGKLETQVGTNGSVAHAVQVQSDGKIVAVGADTGSGSFALVRYNTNGSLDGTFGSAGKALTPGGTANAMAIQPDGKIAVAGTTSSNPPHYGVARYTTNGVLDTTFGGTGFVTTTIGNGDTAQALRIQTDGRLVAAGYSIVGSTYNLSLTRYNTNGSLDLSFGSLGRVTTDFGSGNAALGMGLAIQPDGRLIVAGFAIVPYVSGGSYYFILARYMTNGVLDTTFGNGGKVISQVGFDFGLAAAVALQQDGKIVAGGFSKIGTNNQYAVLRYNTDGSLDNTYGNGGQVLVSFGDGGDDTGAVLALDSLGRAVVGGSANSLFGIERLLGDAAVSVSLTIFRTTTNSAVVSWPSPSTGWSLKQNSNLTSATWVAPAETITDNGTNQFIIVHPPIGTRFFRLQNP